MEQTKSKSIHKNYKINLYKTNSYAELLKITQKNKQNDKDYIQSIQNTE